MVKFEVVNEEEGVGEMIEEEVVESVAEVVMKLGVKVVVMEVVTVVEVAVVLLVGEVVDYDEVEFVEKMLVVEVVDLLNKEDDVRRVVGGVDDG